MIGGGNVAGERSEGLVYYALDATRTDQYVKIGFSQQLRRRVADLQRLTASGQVPIVIALEEGGMPVEQGRHRQFASLRSHGEWFRYDGELVKFLAARENPIGFLLDRPHLWEFADGWADLCPASAARVPRSHPTDLAKVTDPSVAKWNIWDQPHVIFPLRPGRSIGPDGYEVDERGLPPVDF